MHGNGVKTDPHGNLFEGEWNDGKPIVKSGKDAGPLDWLNEAVANVSQNVGIGGNSRGGYSSVATYDEDDEHDRRPPGRH